LPVRHKPRTDINQAARVIRFGDLMLVNEHIGRKLLDLRQLAERDRNINDRRHGDGHRQPENAVREPSHALINAELLPVAKFLNKVTGSNVRIPGYVIVLGNKFCIGERLQLSPFW